MIEKTNIRKTKYHKIISIIIFVILIIFGFVFFSKAKKIEATTNIKPIKLSDFQFEDIVKPYKVSGNPYVYSKASILIDMDNKYVLYGNNEHSHLPIASTTKLTTSLVVMDHYTLNDVLTVDSKAASINGSKMNLYNGEKITVEDLLKGLLLVSGNDAAYTFAENFKSPEGDGFDAFVKAMNKKANELNLLDTHYLNPAGLDDNAYSSAFDLSIIASEFIKNEKLTAITKLSEISVTDISGKIKHTLKNSNRLVLPDDPLYMSEALGLKTGFTGDAGHSLVSAIEYKNIKLISVILNSNDSTPPGSARESRKLLTWGERQVDIQ